MARTVVCARCGVENPDSPIITLCKGCGASLAGARPAQASGPSAAPPAPAPPPSKPPVAAPVRPAAQPVRLKAAQPPPSPEPTEVQFCTNCGTRLDPGSAKCPRCSHRVPERAAPEPEAQPVCPRCGREHPPGRRSCEYCGMHFVGPPSGAHVPLPRSEAAKGRTSAQRTACLVLGCVWLAFGLLIALIAFVASVSR